MKACKSSAQLKLQMLLPGIHENVRVVGARENRFSNVLFH